MSQFVDVKCLQDVVSQLECGIVVERQCTLLLEQHQAAQVWLREQVKGLGPPPADRQGLHNAVNNLKVREDPLWFLKQL